MARSSTKGTGGAPRGLVLFAAIFVAQILSCSAAFQNMPTWYAALRKPDVYPPHVFFGPIWSLAFGLMAATGARLLRTVPQGPARRLAIACIVVQAVLSAVWAEVFFALHRLDAALFIGFWLLASTLASVLATNRVRPTTGLLLSPTLVWVGIAIVANLALYLVNP
jgi:tryptophan-rich sensory protein